MPLRDGDDTDLRRFGEVLLDGDEADRVPFMRARNPISKTNWEGVGVKPGVEVPADKALDTALELAKKAIADKKPKM